MPRRAHAALLALALCATPAGLARADTVVLAPAADTTLYEPIYAGEYTSNGAGGTFYVGKTRGDRLRRALVRFDLSTIPPGSTITRVAFTATLQRSQSGPVDIGLFTCSSSWTEGQTSAFEPAGQGAPAMPGDVTWIHSTFEGTLWNTPGGDYLPGPRAAATADSFGQAVTWGSTPALVADVQAWLNNPASNRGWLIRHIDEGPNLTAKSFATRENEDPGIRPTLTVEFTPPGPLCIADFNDDGIVNSTDVSDFINQWFTDLTEGTLVTDWDNNGVVNSTDVSNFINDWFAAPPECTV
jgi:hypothetical protein